MLQEAHIWTAERQTRWEKTRKKGCLSYVLKMTGYAFIGGLVLSLVYCLATLASGREIGLSTALTIPALGLVSGLITGRAYWGVCESSFDQMRSQSS